MAFQRIAALGAMSLSGVWSGAVPPMRKDDFAALERDWYVGSEESRKELLEQMKAGPKNYEQEVRESGEQKALKRIEVELKKLRWAGTDLPRSRQWPKTAFGTGFSAGIQS